MSVKQVEQQFGLPLPGMFPVPASFATSAGNSANSQPATATNREYWLASWIALWLLLLLMSNCSSFGRTTSIKTQKEKKNTKYKIPLLC